MKKDKTISVLLIDDSAELLRIYKRQLLKTGRFLATTETDGRRAHLLAQRQLFDVVVIDAKLDYRGVEFGGLRLADELRPRYGCNSILLISRFITADLMKAHGMQHDFLSKDAGHDAHSFATVLGRTIKQMHGRQYVFVAMPFAKEFESLYREQIRRGVSDAGYRCVRVDEVAHNRRIQEVIFELVENSKLVAFLADGGNANAYYEAGFADAMKKELLIISKTVAELRFDVAGRHTLTYSRGVRGLSRRLAKKIRSLRLSHPIAI
jgi:CheY-like chemotaxis protein